MGEGYDSKKAIAVLNRILELELAGVVRYTHFSFMVFGLNRIPIVEWLREQARSSLEHANEAGEMLTTAGEQTSLGVGPLLGSRTYDIETILELSQEHEGASLGAYEELLAVVKDRNLLLEEYARRMIYEEERHLAAVTKMLYRPEGAALHFS